MKKTTVILYILLCIVAFVVLVKAVFLIKKIVYANTTPSASNFTYTSWYCDDPKVTLHIKGLDENFEVIAEGKIDVNGTVIEVEYFFDKISKHVDAIAKTKEGNRLAVLSGTCFFRGDKLEVELYERDLLFDGKVKTLFFTRQDTE